MHLKEVHMRSFAGSDLHHCIPSLLSSCLRRSDYGELLCLSCRSVLLHGGSGQPQWPLCCWFLLPLWFLFNHSICLPLSQGKSYSYMLSFFISLYSFCRWIPFPVLPYYIVLIVFLTLSLLEKLVPCCLLLMSGCIECHHSDAPLSFPFSHRATTVLKALPWPCLVPRESTSQTQAQTAASHVDLDSTVKRP